MNKNVYCVIDTETIGGACRPKGTYNIGGLIFDKKGTIIATFSYLVMEHYDAIRKDSYAKKNFHIYEDRLCNGLMTGISTESEAVEAVRNLCKRYNVKYVMAYNSAFDFEKTCCKELLSDFEFIDIYLVALQTATHLKKFQNFCREHELYSKNTKAKQRRVSTSAETLHAFFTSDPHYVEEHTAFNDSAIEMNIFLQCDKMHKHYDRNVHQMNCKKGKCFPLA